MKNTVLAFFFLAFAFAMSTELTPSIAAAVPVMDSNGFPVTNGGIYQIFPAIKGNGGGIVTAALGNETCPVSVVQTPSNVNLGLSFYIRVNSRPLADYVYPTDSIDIVLIVQHLLSGWLSF
ncbi:hypothetical protein L6164_023824 [Bauhinia variegata]|uniref:Uncharacterized protein n=1 Tax=Bauhinia variegata TaxID=167791 RepID=A0ACB9MN33_BAUVA|nr:hypothetical protein L6164_023824 [Bauhinia variegata]